MYKYAEVTEKGIGAAMKIHATLGQRFSGSNLLAGIGNRVGRDVGAISKEMEMPVNYKATNVGELRVGFFVAGKIMAELKAIIQLENMYLAKAKII